ncbi:putative nuclease HARBI1 [Aphis gossypii]|uniref:putative nuclease HARBI1 n=1 Tax=Aphis gossypii TaxID=80765 RepID=UPI002158D37E|nr:putative nuclease HARBI1 [Aphis gossypii]XP_050066255.1 putative nuclease HARBI1 [Aphis gossypii]
MSDFDIMTNFVINNFIENAVCVNEDNCVRNDFHKPLSDPFTQTEQIFIKNFRLTKPVARCLIDMLRPFLKVPSRLSSIDIDTKVLVALNFFATGSYQTPVGNSRYTLLSQASVSCCIKEVVTALNNPTIFNSWVKFPNSIRELTAVRHEFYRKTGFPGVIGCLDCTHVAVVPPSKNLNLNENRYPEYMYVNRKNYHSINVQLICDVNLKIFNVNALFPGSTHDVHIWNNSKVSNTLQELHSRNFNNFFLLGDSGYPLRPWLLTPITHPITAAEELYNKKQMSTRSIIERCNGVLKMRFRCLLKDRVLHYKPEKASQIINACVVLHNMCIEYNVPEIEETEEDIDMGINQDQRPFEEQHDNRNQYLMQGKQQRVKITQLLENRNLHV